IARRGHGSRGYDGVADRGRGHAQGAPSKRAGRAARRARLTTRRLIRAAPVRKRVPANRFLTGAALKVPFSVFSRFLFHPALELASSWDSGRAGRWPLTLTLSPEGRG